MSKVIPVAGALVTAMIAVAPGAFAQDSTYSPWRPGTNTTSTPTNPSRPGTNISADTTLIRNALRGNFTEVALGRQAESNAGDAGVKDFAERMVSDHNEMNQRWATLARNNGMRFELELTPEGEETVERLDDLDDNEYDRAYMTEMIRLHEQDLVTFQQVGRTARSSELRQLANTAATSIQEHLTQARQIGGRVGASTTAGRAGGVTTTRPLPSDSAGRRTSTGSTIPAETDHATSDEREDRENRAARSRLRAEDRAFVAKVLGDHLMHVRLARRAQRETKNDETRRFAERVEKDLSNWSDRWEAFADRCDANVTSHLERTHREKLVRLQRASERKDFDRAYAAIVADHLEPMVVRLREERREERPAGVGRLADKEIPVLRGLLVQARRLEKQATDRMKDSGKK